MKKILRNKLKAVRDGISAAERNGAEKLINSNILEYIHSAKPSIVAGYHTIQSEVDITPSLVNCHLPIALPAINGNVIEFREWDTSESLVNNGKFLEPAESSKKVIPDLILLPTLGFDENGGRIGYGLGFYDKSLPNYPNATLAIVAFSKQKLLAIPLESHDIKAHIIITEEGILQCPHTKS